MVGRVGLRGTDGDTSVSGMYVSRGGARIAGGGCTDTVLIIAAEAQLNMQDSGYRKTAQHGLEEGRGR